MGIIGKTHAIDPKKKKLYSFTGKSVLFMTSMITFDFDRTVYHLSMDINRTLRRQRYMNQKIMGRENKLQIEIRPKLKIEMMKDLS